MLLAPLEDDGLIRRPIIPEDCKHNAHMYYILLKDRKNRDKVIRYMKKKEINTIFHYVPLHSSPAGQLFSKSNKNLPITDNVSSCILRLPMWIGLTDDQIYKVTSSLKQALIS